MELVRFCAVVVSAITLTSSVVECAVKCNSTAVNDVCLKDFHTSVPTEKYLIDNKERKTLCKAFRNFVSCLESTGCHGITSVVPLYNGFKNGIQFVCNETTLQNEFAASCWNSYGFQNAEVFCSEYAKNQTADSERSDCEQKNDLVACLVKSVNKCCSAEAAEYAGQSILAMMVPLMKTKKCQLEVRTGATEIDRCGAYVHPPEEESPGSNAGLIAVIVIIVLVAIIGIVVAVVVLVVKRQRMAAWLRV